jgi:hypothetical protein
VGLREGISPSALQALTERAHEADEEPARLPVVALPPAGRWRWPGYTRSREEGSPARQAASGTRCRSLGSNGGWDIQGGDLTGRSITASGGSPPMATSIRRIGAWSLRAEMAKSGGRGPRRWMGMEPMIHRRFGKHCGSERSGPHIPAGSSSPMIGDGRKGNCSQLPRLDCKAQPEGEG